MPFRLLNGFINPLVRLLIRSPLHPLVSRRIALITFTGRRSGRRYTIPVGYQLDGARLTITVGSPERKVWWRNLSGSGAPVELVVGGQPRSGRAVATRSGPRAIVSVALNP
jgi:F420H(2)-dependent quinone reductase